MGLTFRSWRPHQIKLDIPTLFRTGSIVASEKNKKHIPDVVGGDNPLIDIWKKIIINLKKIIKIIITGTSKNNLHFHSKYIIKKEYS